MQEETDAAAPEAASERGRVFRYYGVNVTRFVKRKMNSKGKGRGKKNISKSPKLGTGKLYGASVE